MAPAQDETALQWVIHIGVAKTGSKALQTFLSSELFRLQGVRGFYPANGRAGIWHEPLYDDLLAGSTSALDAAVTEAESQAAQLAFLSYEGLCDLPTPSIRDLRQKVGSAKIVLFLRRQDQMVNSFYNQLIKAHRSTIEDIEQFEQQLGSYQRSFDYRFILEKWSSVFGRANMRPVIYDKTRSSVVRFFEALGLPITYDDHCPIIANAALDAQGLSILRHIKTHVTDAKVLPIVVEAAHKALSHRFIDTYSAGEFYVIDAPTRRAIMHAYAPSNEWVRTNYFETLPSLFPPVEEGEYVVVDFSSGRDIALELVRGCDLTGGLTPDD
ncbi:MAG TPA: sulfotransferase [Vicinamibacterales bacterium]|nr:sulfotransferase [Vicinamibacterales bacterium]